MRNNSVDTGSILITLEELSDKLRDTKRTRYQVVRKTLEKFTEALCNTADIDFILSTLNNLTETLRKKIKKNRIDSAGPDNEQYSSLDLEKLAEDWPSPFVARNEIENFTKGLYKPRSMSTFDARGNGLKRRIILGNRIAYLKEDVINWLKGKKK